MKIMIEKTLNETCGNLWVVKAARVFFDKEENATKVQIGVSAYKDAAALEAEMPCHQEAFIVPATDLPEGMFAWCENALKTDEASKLKD